MSGNGTDGSPVVSVVIPAYKRPEFVKNAVETAIDQDMAKHLYEVIVVDSSPDDQNALIVASIQKHAECTLRFLSKKPEGPGPSRNMGAREARGKYIAFLDSDCKASRSWLREGLNAFDEGVGLVLGKTIPDPAARSLYPLCVRGGRRVHLRGVQHHLLERRFRAGRRVPCRSYPPLGSAYGR